MTGVWGLGAEGKGAKTAHRRYLRAGEGRVTGVVGGGKGASTAHRNDSRGLVCGGGGAEGGCTLVGVCNLGGLVCICVGGRV